MCRTVGTLTPLLRSCWAVCIIGMTSSRNVSTLRASRNGSTVSRTM